MIIRYYNSHNFKKESIKGGTGNIAPTENYRIYLRYLGTRATSTKNIVHVNDLFNSKCHQFHAKGAVNSNRCGGLVSGSSFSK